MKAIIQTNSNEWTLTAGNTTMRLVRNDTPQNHAWEMFSSNPSSRAWSGVMGSYHAFNSLAEVEQHYKSWRGFSDLCITDCASVSGKEMK